MRRLRHIVRYRGALILLASIHGEQFRKKRSSIAGYLVLLFATLNLNGLFLLLLGTQGLLSPLILCLILILLVCYARPWAITGTYALFFAFMSSYLIFASFASFGSSSFNQTVLSQNSATLLLVSGLYFWLIGRSDSELDRILNTLKIFLLVSCIFVLLSPILGEHLNYIAAADRASGLFENPNEAGVASLLCIVLVYAYPAQNRVMMLVQTIIPLSALALTFSKTCIITLTFFVAIILIRKRSIGLLCLAVVLFGLAVLTLTYVRDNGLVHFTYDQRERIADLLSIFGGEISSKTTTGRTDLWAIGIERILEQLPWGGGIGEFHALEGTRRTVMYPDDSSRIMYGNWLGVHNAYLMVLGEAGLLPFLLLMIWIVRLFVKASQAPERGVALALGIIVCTDMMASHGSLGFRLVDVAVALMMALGERPSIMLSRERHASSAFSSAYCLRSVPKARFSIGSLG